MVKSQLTLNIGELIKGGIYSHSFIGQDYFKIGAHSKQTIINLLLIFSININKNIVLV